jgi:hypothetical protein
MLKFVNATDQDLWVAYMFLAQVECGGEGGDWQAIGWLHMVPGGSTIPYLNDLDVVNNRYWYYYVENPDRRRRWAGPHSVYVPASGSAFNHCSNFADTNSGIIGIRQFVVGDSDNFTMTLFHLDLTIPLPRPFP